MEDNNQNTALPSQEEKLIGLIAHFSIFFGGFIVPFVLWIIYKDKSKFVKFHSLQSLIFHIAFIFALVMFMIIIIGIGALAGVINADDFNNNEPPLFFILTMIFSYIVLIAGIFFLMGYSVYMGVKAYQGENKKYPVVGSLLYRNIYGA